MPRNCATPRCSSDPGYGRKGRFCEPCAEILRKISEDIATEGKNMHKGAIDPLARKKPKLKRIPTCCTIGCYEPRVPPSAFCDQCVGAGAVQDVD